MGLPAVRRERHFTYKDYRGWPEDEDDIDTVLQPDVAVFCHPERLTNAGATGAPDLGVEVLSPWTMKKDLR